MFLIVVLVGFIPAVQTLVASKITDRFNQQFSTSISILRANLTFSGSIALNDVLINDHKQDTLFFVNKLEVSALGLNDLISSSPIISSMKLKGLKVNLKTYKNDSISNLNRFTQQFQNKQSDSIASFLMKAGLIEVIGGRAALTDENNLSGVTLLLNNIDFLVNDFEFNKNDFKARINDFSLTSSEGIDVTSFRSNVSFFDQKFKADALHLETNHSLLKGMVSIDIQKKDIQTALWNIEIFDSYLGLKDINVFNASISNKGQIALETNLKGSLIDFSVSTLKLSSSNTFFEGSFLIKNLFDRQTPFVIENQIDRFSFSESSINQLFPSAFGSVLPSSLKHLGELEIKGQNVFSPKSISSNIIIEAAAGTIESDLLLREFSDIDNALYDGVVSSSNFDLGVLLNNDRFDKVDFNFDLYGKGMTVDLIDSSLSGIVSSIDYNQNVYDDISISGDIKNGLFEGKIVSSDPNLDFNFDGIVDFSGAKNYFDFNASFVYVNLYRLGLSPDPKSVFSGDVSVQIEGNSQKDFIGDLSLNNTSFITSDKLYDFETLNLQSRNSDGVRVININSEDVLSGILIGQFSFLELPNLIQNSISNTFTKRKLLKVTPGQYLTFNFNVNTKIASALYPNVVLDDNTYIKGKIDSDNKIFRLSLRMPSLQIEDAKIEQLNLQIDNQNSLFNTFLEVGGVDSKYAKIKDVNLINTYVRDTLFFRAEYDDPLSLSENHQVNFYHTIDSLNNSVIGFKYSEFNIKNNRWILKPNDSKSNKIIIDSKEKRINIKPFKFSHSDEELFIEEFSSSPNQQRLKLSFKDVQLKSILSEIPRLDLDGKLNGTIDFDKTDQQYLANSSIKITPLSINNYPYETVSIDVTADKGLQSFNLMGSVIDNQQKVMNIEGYFEVNETGIPLDISVNLNEFPVAPFSPLGKNTLSNFKGSFSGDLQLGGLLSSMSMDGQIFMIQSGLSIPYLGVDFDFSNKPSVLFSNQTIHFERVDLKDTNYQSEGILKGIIEHKNFKNWALDLTISSDRLSILHTSEDPDFLYYGDAFLSGNAHLFGPAKLLTIDVDGSTAKGTSISIPINEATKIDKASYIKFVDKRIYEQKENTPFTIEDIKGLTLNFDLDVTKDAEVAIVVDPETGSSLKGRGAGNILMEINTNGRFNIWGDFIAYEGVYNFKNLGIFEKEFILKEGGTIVWDGDPLQAQLNMDAEYTVPGGANPALLSEDLNLNRKIPTLVTTTLTGNLLKLDTPVFSIDFPNTSGAIKSELDYRLSDQEKRQLQAVSLLVQGFFISDVSLSSVSSETFYNNVFQKFSGIFDALFADDDGKINVGLNYLKGDKNAAATLKTRDRLGLTLTTKISDRILLNGKFGVPVSGIEETVFVGDVEIEFLLNKDGSLRARIFNKENEFQYIGDELGFTQGGGLSYQVNFDSFKKLLEKMIRKNEPSSTLNFPTVNSPFIQIIPKESKPK
ncbi:MAG: translocation/assembly module TamB domain-containing protein [Flavobacteriaceae bacterium]|nr:translocation/assembly module TamB domain-containing protein [Flavobacteriaceae bacterium]